MNGYTILSFDNIDDLTAEVNRRWKEGWRPNGGISITKGIQGSIYLQAIVREDRNVTIDVSPRKDSKKLLARSSKK